MNTPKISIIVPIYNTERYLDKCLQSLVDQTFRDIEIICINDASTDSSLEIIQKWAKLDNRIIIIDSKKNLRQGGGEKPRNKEIKRNLSWFCRL